MTQRPPMLVSLTALAVAAAFAVGHGCSSGKGGDITGDSKNAQAPAPAPQPELPPPVTDGGTGGATGGSEGGSEGGTTGDESLEDILKQCGVKASDLEDPDKVVLEKKLKSFPKHLGGTQEVPILGTVNYQVSVTTKIDVKATVGEAVQTVDFDVTGEPPQAKEKAEATVLPQKGTTTAKALPTEERAALMSENAQWKGILCTIQPTRELITAKGGYTKKIKFDPPLPGSISPKADAKRYAAEIGSGKEFNVTAEVTSSNDPKLAKGEKIKGKVTVKPINPELTINIGGTGGQQKKVKTDAAFKFTVDFGGQEAALGLIPETTYYISHKARDLKIIVADTKDSVAGIQVLSDEL